MNCSDSRRLLRRLAKRLWRELRLGGRASPANASRPAAGGLEEEEEDDAYLYILLIMVFYGCLAGGLILAYTRSRKLESKHDPYHLYIESDWTEGGPARGAAAAAGQLRQPSLEEEGAAGGAASPGDRRSSADSEPL